MAERTRKPFDLGLDPAAYNPVGLRAYDEEVVAHEYARLRREANDRLRKLGKSEFADSKAYTENVGRFKPLAEIRDRTELDRLTQEAAQFVMARGSSASGQRGIRRDAIAALKARKINFVNTKNFKQFTEMMDEIRAKDEATWKYNPDTAKKDPTKRLSPRQLEQLFEAYQNRGMEGVKEWQTKKPGKKAAKKANPKRKGRSNTKKGKKQNRRKR